jgi:hypothetical protein
MERLEALLDAYGAREDRWPEDARQPARTRLEQSPQARAARERAARLDGVLDAAPAEEATADLSARILADFDAVSAPSTRRRAAAARPRIRRYLAAAVPLAAAAVALWLVRTPDQSLDGGPQIARVGIARLGIYEAPTDEWLDPLGVDLFGTLPGVGCADNGLGCIDVDTPDGIEIESKLAVIERRVA